MATRNPANTFIDSSDPSESEPTLTSGDSDDLTSESESEEDNPGSSKVTEPPRDASRAKPAAISRPRALLLNPPGQRIGNGVAHPLVLGKRAFTIVFESTLQSTFRLMRGRFLQCMPNRSKFEGQFVEETHGYGTPYSREGAASTAG